MTGLSHKDDLLETPPWLFNQIEKETGLKFKTDLCASYENKKCENYIDEEQDMFLVVGCRDPIWCNPPRSINGKCVDFVYNYWQTRNEDIVMLLTWNDLGNKYGEKLWQHILSGDIGVKNLGKVKFYKNGKETEFPSRLTYFYAWFKKKH